jgi:proton glutamate symport protein
MQLYTKILLGMFIGVVSGLLFGPNSSLLPNDGVRLSSSASVVTSAGGSTGVATAKGLRDAKVLKQKSDPSGGGDWLKIQWKLSPAQQLRLKTEGGASTNGAEGRLHTGWVQEQIPQVRRYATIGQGIVDYTEWIGRLFLALIKMVVVPLVFFSLVVGIASLGDVRKLGRMGGRTLGFFMLTTMVALVIGVGLANLIQPGSFLDETDRQILLSSYETAASSTVSSAAAAPTFTDQLISIVPTNPLAALASGNMLQIIFFAMMLGVALTFLKDGRAKLVVDVFDRLNEAMVMLVHIAMKLAPVGVGALLFKVVGNTGVSVLLALGVYGLVVLLGLFLHLTLTYGTVVRFGAGLGFLPFLSAIKEAMLVAFSTSSSSATLPVTMQCCEENLNVSSETTSFVLPLGATVNMDGTALYQGVAAIFIAQIYGMDLTLGDQATIVFSATMASVGAAGVPGAGMITLAMVLTAIGVPTEGLALILGVDRLLDMFRTATNVVGDSTATVLMAKLEGEKLRIMTDAEDAARTDKGFQGRLEHGQTAIHTDDGTGDFGQ